MLIVRNLLQKELPIIDLLVIKTLIFTLNNYQKLRDFNILSENYNIIKIYRVVKLSIKNKLFNNNKLL